MRFYRKWIHLKQRVDGWLLRLCIWYLNKRMPRRQESKPTIVMYWDERIRA